MTNAVTYLSQVDQIVVLEEGEISDMGSYHELMAHNGHFTEFITTYLNEVEEDEKHPRVVSVIFTYSYSDYLDQRTF